MPRTSPSPTEEPVDLTPSSDSPTLPTTSTPANTSTTTRDTAVLPLTSVLQASPGTRDMDPDTDPMVRGLSPRAQPPTGQPGPAVRPPVAACGEDTPSTRAGSLLPRRDPLRP